MVRLLNLGKSPILIFQFPRPTTSPATPATTTISITIGKTTAEESPKTAKSKIEYNLLISNSFSVWFCFYPRSDSFDPSLAERILLICLTPLRLHQQELRGYLLFEHSYCVVQVATVTRRGRSEQDLRRGVPLFPLHSLTPSALRPTVHACT